MRVLLHSGLQRRRATSTHMLAVGVDVCAGQSVTICFTQGLQDGRVS